MTPNPARRTSRTHFKELGYQAATIPAEDFAGEESHDQDSLSIQISGETTSLGGSTNAFVESSETTGSFNGLSISVSSNGHRNETTEIVDRLRRAQANALFDQEAVRYLYRFNLRVTVGVEEVDEWIEEPIGWTKIAQLMQAYFVEVVGFHLRITEQGKDALAGLRSFVSQPRSSDEGVD